MTRVRLVAAWMIAWVALFVWMAAPLRAQTGAGNGRQFNITVTNGAVVTLTVPQGTTFCTIGVKNNAINYDVGTGALGAGTAPAPTTTTGVQASSGAVIQLASFILCSKFGAIAQSANAQLDVIYFR